MWQTLFRIPNSVDAFGIHISILKSADSPYGVGLLFFVALICGGIGLWNKYRREGTSDDFRWALAIWAAICAVIVFIVPRLVDDVGLPIRGYGAMLLVAVVSAVALGMWRAAQAGANPEIILAMMFPIFIGGILGARVVYVAEYWEKQFKPDSQITVRTADGEKTIVLDGDTFVTLDGDKAPTSALRAGQRVDLTTRQRDQGLYARRVAAHSEAGRETTTDGATVVTASHVPWSAIGKSIGRIVNVTTGGLVVYGAFLGAILPFGWFVWKHGLPILALCDIVVASLLLGQALGRIGCLCNGCCYGSVCETPNLPRFSFPFQSPAYLQQVETGKLFIAGLTLKKVPTTDEVEILAVEPNSPAASRGLKPGMRLAAMALSTDYSGEGARQLLAVEDGGKLASTGSIADPTLDEAYRLLYGADNRALAVRVVDDGGSSIMSWAVSRASPPQSRPVQPTQIYEAFYAGLMALFAWLYFPFRRRDGEVFALMLTIFPISRFLMEYVRSDESQFVAGVMTISQAISVGLFLSSFAFWWWVRRQPRDSTLTRDDWAKLNARWAAAA